MNSPRIAISSASPSSITLVRGGSAQSVTVSLRCNGFTGSVTLATSALPIGVTATFTERRTGNSGNSSLEAASDARLVSNQTVTIGAGGRGVASATSTFALTLTAAGTPTTNLNSPTTSCCAGNSTYPAGRQIDLSWSASGATLPFDIYRNGALIYTTASSVSSSSQNITGLTARQSYSYYVAGKNANGNTSSNTVSATAPTGCP